MASWRVPWSRPAFCCASTPARPPCPPSAYIQHTVSRGTTLFLSVSVSVLVSLSLFYTLYYVFIFSFSLSLILFWFLIPIYFKSCLALWYIYLSCSLHASFSFLPPYLCRCSFPLFGWIANTFNFQQSQTYIRSVVTVAVVVVVLVIVAGVADEVIL